METLIAGPHKDVIRAPRGTRLRTKGWQQEAAMRMLMNNLDPEVAEAPDQLVVYGGTGRAARSWAAYAAIVRSLRELRDDETLLVQSGKPVGVFRTHEWSPRVLIANSNLVPEWATWDEFRRLVDLHRLAGHRAGHLRVLRRDRPAPPRRVARRHDHPDRWPRRHGGRAAACRPAQRGRRAVRRGRPRAHRAPPAHSLPRRARRGR